jgi:hypothetical protein
MMFGKFFASTFTGSMYGAGTDVFAVWGYVIAHANDSSVELNPRQLADVLGATVERIQAAIDVLCAPDPRSRNPEQDGRRLVHEAGFQFHVVSHQHYRAIRNDDDRRAYNREKQREHRAKMSSNVASMTNMAGQRCQPIQKQRQKQRADADPEGGGGGTRTAPLSDPDARAHADPAAVAEVVNGLDRKVSARRRPSL